jgi:flagellar hook-associated protein 2
VGAATQTAKNAVATLDGSILVQSSTNTFSSAIPDVSFTANQAGANATITVASSSSSTVTAVQTWMSAYNSVVDLLNTDTSYTPATSNSAAQSGPLFADANASGLISALPSTAEALVGSGTAYQDLAAIGIIVNPQNGHLGFQSSSDFTSGAVIQSGQTLFTNALQTNSSAVQSLFGVVTGTTDSTAIPTSGVLGNVYKVVNSFGTSSGSGTIGDELTSIGKQVGFLNSYLTQVNQQIQDQVNAFASQLQQLNTVMAHTQAQMQTVLALIGGSASSSSSSGSSSSSSTIP